MPSSLEGNPALCGDKIHVSCKSRGHNKLSTRTRLAVMLSCSLGLLLLLAVLAATITNRWRLIMTSPEDNIKDLEAELSLAHDLKRFTIRDLEIATDSFNGDNVIASSSLSTVYRGRLQDGGRLIAVKKLNLHQSQADECFLAELKTLGYLKHRNLVKVVGYAWEPSKLKALALEFMENGSLEDVIHDAGAGTDFPGDGNLSTTSSAFQGTIGYLAPEFAYTRKVTTKVDVFSFGIVVMEFLTGRRPTAVIEEDGRPQPLHEFVAAALAGGVGDVLDIFDSEMELVNTKEVQMCVRLLGLATSCARADPDARPNMDCVLSTLLKILAALLCS